MRGQADFGMYAPKLVSASISDMGEVAARLGSIVTYDKRGEVVDFDNFEDSILKWTITRTPEESYARLTSYNVKSGSQAVHLNTPDEDDASIAIAKPFPFLGSKHIAAEISFSWLKADVDLELEITHFDGTTEFYAFLVFDPSASILSVLDEEGALIPVITSLTVREIRWTFHTLKLVVDCENGYYKRLMLNQGEYDISTIKLTPDFYIAAPRVDICYRIRNRAAVGGYVWLDDFVITQAEP